MAASTGSSAAQAGALATRATASDTTSVEANNGASNGRGRITRRVTGSVLELRDVHLVPLVDLGAKRDHAAGRAGDVVIHLGSGAHERARATVDVGNVDRVVRLSFVAHVRDAAAVGHPRRPALD